MSDIGQMMAVYFGGLVLFTLVVFVLVVAAAFGGNYIPDKYVD